MLARATAEGAELFDRYWWPTDSVIISQEYDGRLPCNNRGYFQAGCPRGSLNDVSFAIWPKVIGGGGLAPFGHQQRRDLRPRLIRQLAAPDATHRPTPFSAKRVGYRDRRLFTRQALAPPQNSHGWYRSSIETVLQCPGSPCIPA